VLRVRLIYTLSIQTMFKSLLAATAATICCLQPAAASVGSAFDTATRPKSGECYTTTGGHSVCWQRLGPTTYGIALREKNNQPDYATTIYLTCGGRWEAYGPGNKTSLQALADAFCEEQGH
jgi:hypothetical protein